MYAALRIRVAEPLISRPAGRFRADPPTARVWRRAWLPPEARGSRPAAFWLKAGVPVSIRGFFRDRRPDRTRKRVGPDSFCQKAKLGPRHILYTSVNFRLVYLSFCTVQFMPPRKLYNSGDPTSVINNWVDLT